MVYTVLLARAQRDPALATLLTEVDAAWRGWLMHLLERGCCQGVFRHELAPR